MKNSLHFGASVHWYSSFLTGEKREILCEEKFVNKPARNRISLASDKGVVEFSIPLVHKSLGESYRNCLISYKENWPSKFMNLLDTCYGKSAYYEYYDYRIREAIDCRFDRLYDLNIKILEISLHFLKVEKDFQVHDGTPDEISIPEIQTTYYQTFADKCGFLPNLSILDLIFNEGPDSGLWLKSEYKSEYQ